jgi:hypothetical protein
MLSNNDVLVIAVNGVVGGVNAPVYTAVFLTKRTSVMYPEKSWLVLVGLPAPIFVVLFCTLYIVLAAALAPSTPLINNLRVVPSQVAATWFHAFTVKVVVVVVVTADALLDVVQNINCIKLLEVVLN